MQIKVARRNSSDPCPRCRQLKCWMVFKTGTLRASMSSIETSAGYRCYTTKQAATADAQAWKQETANPDRPDMMDFFRF